MEHSLLTFKLQTQLKTLPTYSNRIYNIVELPHSPVCPQKQLQKVITV